MSLTPAEQNYGQIEKEALALIEATDKFGPADALSRLISSKRQKNDEEDKIIASCEIEPVLDSGIKEMIRPLPITFNEFGTSDEQIVNSLADQMKEVLDSGEFADVQFLVGEEKEATHRAILSSASDVFKTMFRYDVQNSKNSIGKGYATEKKPIFVPDIEIEAFKAMLTFIYTKHFNGLDANNWLDVLKAEAFLQIDQDLFCEILKRDQLRISEVEIWNEALRWADEQCQQNDIECSTENRREMLGPALFKIRFSLISKEDFTKSVVPTDVLTKEEVISIYQHYCHPNLINAPGLIKLKFPTHRRYKKGGTIEMEIEKVSQFAVEKEYSRRLSDAMEIGEFSWKIMTIITTKNKSNEKWLSFYLKSDGPGKDDNWSRKCSATFRIISQKNGTEDLIGRFNDIILDTKGNNFGFPNFISFAELLDPSKGFYNKDEDKVKLAIDVIVDDPKTEKFYM
ncbi:hypothetical protein niasHT_003450 [Heterodera trifolii]|uniref:BTB domain-containing protein n=1 Tax=Heterodera trifolii TaxID=157864 RepID=A0ABD2M1Y4_9BILA